MRFVWDSQLVPRCTPPIFWSVACFAIVGLAPVALASVDLSISDVSLDSDTVVPGASIRLQITVHHAGSCPDCGSLQITSWDDSADGNLSCADGDDLSLEADLTSDGDITVPLTLNGYPRPGHYRAWFWVDCQQTVSDSDQSNNKQYFDINIAADAADSGAPTDAGRTPDPVDGSPADSGNTGTPGFCGLFGGQSTLSAAVIPTLCFVGFLGLKARRSW